EVVSLEDVVLLTPEVPEGGVESEPHPPVRGALRTLPPTRAKGDAAPPPTITVEERDPSEAETVKVTPKTVAKAAAQTSGKSGKSEKTDKKPAAKDSAKTAKPSSVATERTPAGIARSASPEEAPKRGWLVPSVIVTAGLVVVWRLMAAPSKVDSPPTATAAA